MSPSNERDEDEAEREDPKLEGDWGNIFLLTYIYFLQCLPRGLGQAMPFILQERKITYADQAGFSLSLYPYCFKVLWSPIVDSVYSRRMGRRKTWAISMQFLIGLSLLLLAIKFDDWLGSEDGTRTPKTRMVAIVFFLCVLFGSTHDIAVDGWAITMLKRRNVGHQTTTNMVGWTLSVFFGFDVFLILGAKDFGNFFRGVPQDSVFIKFPDFILFWAVLSLVSTVLLWLFKKENNSDVIDENGEQKLGIVRSYILLWQIVLLKPIQTFFLIMLTGQATFTTQIGVCNLKLLDAGFSSTTLAFFTIPSLAFLIFTPFLLGKYLTGRRSMRIYLKVYLSRIVVGVALAASVFFALHVKDRSTNSFPLWYYCTVVFFFNVDKFLDSMLWTATGSFFSHVSDARLGGMYLTLFNVVSHIGLRWPMSLSLWLVNPLSIWTCSSEDANLPSFYILPLWEFHTFIAYLPQEIFGERGSYLLKGVFLKNGNTCKIFLDGYYTEVILCSLFGIIWLCWAKKQIYQLEKLAPSAWKVQIAERVVKEQVALTSRDVNTNEF